MRNPKIAIITVTVYLLVFTLSGQLGANPFLMFTMFALSPLSVLWMVYTVLKFGIPGRELKENEAWAYEDFEGFPD